MARLIICLVFFLLTKTSFSGDQTPPAVQNQITSLNIDGYVEVSLKVDSSGQIQIISVESSSQYLSEYVIEKLRKTKLVSGNGEPGKVVKYRFVFKKQA
ncbi:MAG: energy transducer TonB [Flavobacteriales bacterium]